ncbi:MAG: MEDS domain-containing protein [Marine Group I thaumarchaeote]|nr:MAG: MEDS domain-containing protein [Marine Group I thaumarchaeote]
MFLDNVENYFESLEKGHILLLHENKSKGEEIVFGFIKKGLEKGECCCYSTNEPEEITRRMSDYGIDMERYKKRNLLSIISTPDSLEEFSKMVEKVITTLTNSSLLCRFVFSNNFEFDTPIRTSAREKIEQILDDKLSKIPSKMICSYHIARIKQNLANDFMTNLLDSHHSVIIQTKDGKVETFNLP